MKKPWNAKVTYDEERQIYRPSVSGLNDIFGSDELFDHLIDKAQAGKSFDARATIKLHLKPLLNQLENSLFRPAPLQILNLVRESVDLQPLSELIQPKPHQRIPAKIFEILTEQNISFSHMKLKKGAIDKRANSYLIKKASSPSIYVLDLTTSNAFNLRNFKQLLKKLPLIKIEKEYTNRFYIEYDAKKGKTVKLKCEQKDFYLESTQNGSHKFWQAKRVGGKIEITFGKIGSTGRKTVKKFESSDDAHKELHKLVTSKLKKGYVVTL